MNKQDRHQDGLNPCRFVGANTRQRLNAMLVSARGLFITRSGLGEMRGRTEAVPLACSSIRRRLALQRGKMRQTGGGQKKKQGAIFSGGGSIGPPRGGHKNSISERAAQSPEKSCPNPATQDDFLRVAATTALVLCDRDNLSPLKEFRDISSRVLSVAKTGLVRDVLTAEERHPLLLQPHSAPPTGQTRKNWGCQKEAHNSTRPQLSPGIRNVNVLLFCLLLKENRLPNLFTRPRQATWLCYVVLHANATLSELKQLVLLFVIIHFSGDRILVCESAGSHASLGDDSVSVSATGTHHVPVWFPSIAEYSGTTLIH